MTQEERKILEIELEHARDMKKRWATGEAKELFLTDEVTRLEKLLAPDPWDEMCEPIRGNRFFKFKEDWVFVDSDQIAHVLCKPTQLGMSNPYKRLEAADRAEVLLRGDYIGNISIPNDVHDLIAKWRKWAETGELS